MNWATWKLLTPTQRHVHPEYDTSKLNPQLTPYEGKRVCATTVQNEHRHFKVGRSVGWQPIYLELSQARSTDGFPAESTYLSVTEATSCSRH